MKKIVCLFVHSAYAAPITYDVNRTIGSGSVIGTITTDGTIGTYLTASNFIDWNLTLSIGSNSATIISNNSTLSINDITLTATLSALSWDFNSATGAFNIIDNSSAFNFRRWEFSNTYEYVYFQDFNSNPYSFFTESFPSGKQVIGSAQGANIPEPASIALLAMGFAGMSFARKTRNH